MIGDRFEEVPKMSIELHPRRDECKMTEPWFKTRYTVEDISEERRKRWADPEVIGDFHLPEPNVFIAEGRVTWSSL